MIRETTRCAHCGSLGVDGLALDTNTGTLTWAGRSVHCQPAQVRMLRVLIEADGATVRHAGMVGALWGHRWDGGPDAATDVVKVQMSRLRRALIDLGAPVRVRTVHGIGYQLVMEGP